MLNECERTFAVTLKSPSARSALLKQPAVPRNYEIWYVYATGYNPGLNNAINETLSRTGRLTEADLEQIYDTYLSQSRMSDRLDKVGARVLGEIDEVMISSPKRSATRRRSATSSCPRRSRSMNRTTRNRSLRSSKR